MMPRPNGDFMPRIAIIIGLLCITLGLGLMAGAISHEKNPVTAGIPAYVGLIFIGLGLASRRESLRKHLMHLLAALSLLLTLGGLGMSIPKMIQYYGGSWPEGAEPRVLAWWGQLGLAVLMGVFLVLAMRSFIAARKARQTSMSSAA
jgi:hypothetical protein